MEETFMRFAKTSGGLLGLFNCGAYQKWCRTTSARTQLYELTLEMCGMIDDPEMLKAGKHRELEPAQIKKSELAVQSVISAINGFTNP
ncbi:Regulation of enolase protein 1 [Dissostichus eleginoides]|uniref:Regulation of enolase protein 1 n=1 Tax=Dissostichus eleginoides TaxID=100907 RepID=A0AAD9FN01_DISEL|nr:Regulation of enolase protein 1 [Dissostichus eleginoides]